MTARELFLKDLLERIEPTAVQIAAASRSQNALRVALDSGQMGWRIQRDYLIGSYARQTAIRPVDDVDIVFEVDATPWLGTLARVLALKPEPTTVLASFARAIRYRYPSSSVRLQNRSVRLQMYHLDIDVVPALPGTGGRLWIPDRRAGGWIESDPVTHSEIITDINRRSRGIAKPIIKLVKAWNVQQAAAAQMRSFALETMAARLLHSVTPPDLFDGLVMFFDIVAHVGGERSHYRWESRFGMTLTGPSPTVPDITPIGANTLRGLEGDRLIRFRNAAARSRDRFVAATQTKSSARAVALMEAAFRLS